MMNFTDATIEHDKDKDVYLESDPDWIWYGSSISILLVNKKTRDGRPIEVHHTKALDWCVVEEKKLTLSDKVQELDESGSVNCKIYFEEDIQKFIDDIKKAIHLDVSTDDKINKLAGDRFK